MRVALLLVWTLLLAACATTPFRFTQGGEARPLRIVLTNDDGYEAAGIRTVRQALIDAGHEVTMIAPSENRSGSSVALTTHGSVVVRKVEPGIFAVDGTPADCVNLALEGLAPRPVDLVVSGVNFGQNVGARTVSSGTVGAAVSAASRGIPAIAVSQAVDSGDVSVTPRYFPDAADFTTALVAQLASQTGQMMPPGVILNVNYPARHAESVKGVRVTRQGRGGLYHLRYEHDGTGGFKVQYARSEDKEPVPGADTTALADGYVSITPLEGTWNVSEPLFESLRPLADDFPVSTRPALRVRP